MSSVPDGSYRIIYCLGNDWDSQTRCFTRNLEFSSFADHCIFLTTVTRDRLIATTHFMEFRLTLHTVVGGEARTVGIGQEEFLRYEIGELR